MATSCGLMPILVVIVVDTVSVLVSISETVPAATPSAALTT